MAIPHGRGPASTEPTTVIRRGVDEEHHLAAAGRDVDVLAIGGRHGAHRAHALAEIDRLQRTVSRFTSMTVSVAPVSDGT